MTKGYINQKATYEIVDLETGKVIETYRLKAAAMEGLLRYSREYRKVLEIKRIK